MKNFFQKAKRFVVSHKLLPILVVMLLVGTMCFVACAKDDPPAPEHTHTYSDDWSHNDTSHWHDATCEHTDEKSDIGAHEFDNACDTTCNVCGKTRTTNHVYDNDCDTTCNVCGATRTVPGHVYDNDCDDTCNVCGATRTVPGHVYDDDCDTTCNVCGDERAPGHSYSSTLTAGETTHWYECSTCHDKKDEEPHSFVLEIANDDTLKSPATATENAVYYKSCECGAISDTETFETDKTAGTLTDVSDPSKTYDGTAASVPTYETNSTGTVTIEWYSGTTLLPEAPKNAGTYTVKVLIAESDTHTAVSTTKEFTISKRAIWAEDVEFVYDRYTYFLNDGSFTIEFENLVAGETIDTNTVLWTFDANMVGATLVSVAFDTEYVADHPNYTIDSSKCTAEIVARNIDTTDVVLTKVYDGEEKTTLVYYFTEAQGVAEDEYLSITVVMNTGSAGASGLSHSWGSSNSASNYTFDGKTSAEFGAELQASATITPADLDVTGVELTKVFEGTERSTISYTFTPGQGLVDDEELSLTVVMTSGDANATGASYSWGASVSASNYTFGGMTADEFGEEMQENADITPKALTLKDGVDPYPYERVYFRTNSLYTLFIDTADLDGYVGEKEQIGVKFNKSSGVFTVGTYTTADFAEHGISMVGISVVGDQVGVNYDLSGLEVVLEITPAELSVIDLTAVYNGTTTFTVDNHPLTSKHGVHGTDEVYVTSFEMYDPYVTDEDTPAEVIIEGADAANYKIQESFAAITPATLTITPLYDEIILVKNAVNAALGYIPMNSYTAGCQTYVALEGVVPADAETLLAGYVRYNLTTEQFEVVSTLECSSSYTVQVAEGTDVTILETAPEALTLGSAVTLTEQGLNQGERYYFTLNVTEEGCYYYTDLIDDGAGWASVKIYRYGAPIEETGDNMYYLRSGSPIFVVVTSPNRFDYGVATFKIGKHDGLVFDCDNAYSQDWTTAKGSVFIIKLAADGTMNDFYFKPTAESDATFTYEVYDTSDNSLIAQSTEPVTEFYEDVNNNGTEKLVIITIVTAGDISITVE